MSASRFATLAFAFSALAIGTPVSLAQEIGRECVTIADDGERLSCFDKAFGVGAGDAPPAVGEWEMRTETSRLIDRVDVYLTVESGEAVPIDYGEPQRARFQISCRDNVTTATFWIGGNYLSDYGVYGQLLYRVDDHTSQAIRAKTTADSEYIGLLSGAAAIPFVKALFGGQRLLVSARPVNQSDTPVEMEFNITGLEEAVAPLRRSCNW